MASGNFNSAAYGNNTKIQLQCSWSSTPNTEGNYSLVSVIAYLSFYSLDISGRQGSITINGSTVNYNVPAIDTTGGVTIMTRSDFRVDHNSDGTKSIDMSASFPLNAEYSEVPVGTMTATANNVALDNIPRASEIVSVADFNVEDAFSVVTDKKSLSFTDTLSIAVGGQTVKTISDYTSGDDITFTDEEQLEIYNLIDDWDDTFTFTLSTYNGGTLIGSDTETATGTIKGDVTYHTTADKGATFYVGTSDGVKRCITYDGTKRTYI